MICDDLLVVYWSQHHWNFFCKYCTLHTKQHQQLQIIRNSVGIYVIGLSKPGFDAQVTFGDMVILSKKGVLQQVLILLLAITVWVNSFQALKIQTFLSSAFVKVMILHMVVTGKGEGLIQEHKMKYEDERKPPEVSFGVLLDLPCTHSIPN